jgi:predicted secreted hydrolase
MRVSTPLPDQELRTLGDGIAYWEGMIQVVGTAGGRPVRGRGYLEMTGYRGSLGRVMSVTGSSRE